MVRIKGVAAANHNASLQFGCSLAAENPGLQEWRSSQVGPPVVLHLLSNPS